MTAEAVEHDPGVLVATGAELLLLIDWNEVSVCILVGMTIDTTGKTVVSLAYTLVHGNVALMLDQFKVTAAHKRRGCDTGIQFFRLETNSRFAVLSISSQACGRAKAQQQNCCSHQ